MFDEVKNFAIAITDPVFLGSAAMAGGILITVMTLAGPLLKGDQLNARMKSVATDRESLRRKNRANLSFEHSERGTLRKTAKGPWKNIVDSLNLQKLLEDPNVTQKLLEAGLRGPGPLAIFYFCRFATPFLFLMFAVLYVSFINKEMAPNMRLIAIMGACVAGFYLPNVIVSNIASKRRKSIMKAFPDALDLLLICVESGMSIEAAFMRVGAEIGSSSLDLAEELGLTNAELAYLQDRRVAY